MNCFYLGFFFPSTFSNKHCPGVTWTGHLAKPGLSSTEMAQREESLYREAGESRLWLEPHSSSARTRMLAALCSGLLLHKHQGQFRTPQTKVGEKINRTHMDRKQAKTCSWVHL